MLLHLHELRVRACTTTPDAAAAFFTFLLHPTPSARLTSLQALNHMYLKRCVQQMQDFYRQSAPSQDAACVSPEVHSLASAPLPDSTGFFPKLALARRRGFRHLQSAVSSILPARSKVDELAEYFPDYVHAACDAELAANLAADSVSDRSDSRARCHQGMAQLLPASPVTELQPPASKQPPSLQMHASANPAAAAAIGQERQTPVSAPGPTTEAAGVQQQSMTTQQASASTESASQQQHSASGQQAPASLLPRCTTRSPGGPNEASAQQQQQSEYKTMPSPGSASNAQQASAQSSSCGSQVSPRLQTDTTAPNRFSKPLMPVNTHQSAAVSLQSEPPTTTLTDRPNQATEVAAEEDACPGKELSFSDAESLNHRASDQGQNQELPAAVQDPPSTHPPAGHPSTANPMIQDNISLATDSDAAAAAAVNAAVQFEGAQDIVPPVFGATRPARPMLSCKTAVKISSHPVEILPEDEEAMTNAEPDNHLHSHPLQLSPLDEEDLDWCQAEDQQCQSHRHKSGTVEQGVDSSLAASVFETASAQQGTSPYLSWDLDYSQAFRQPVSQLQR